jgi:hypothetical protein
MEDINAAIRDEKEKAALEQAFRPLRILSGLRQCSSGIFRWSGQYASFESSP